MTLAKDRGEGCWASLLCSAPLSQARRASRAGLEFASWLCQRSSFDVSNAAPAKANVMRKVEALVGVRPGGRHCWQVASRWLCDHTPSGAHEPLEVFIVAGEPSGDVIGARLMRSLAQRSASEGVSIRFQGIGGERMAREGLQSLFPMSDLTVMGVTSVLTRLPTLWSRLKQTVQHVVKQRPAALITIDSKGFNRRLAKRVAEAFPAAANCGNQRPVLVQYVGPSVWAFKSGLFSTDYAPHAAAKRFAAPFDAVLSVLPWEPPFYNESAVTRTAESGECTRASCAFVGYPALDGIRDALAWLDCHACTTETLSGDGSTCAERSNDELRSKAVPPRGPNALIAHVPAQLAPSSEQRGSCSRSLDRLVRYLSAAALATRERLGIAADETVVGIFAGSRPDELQRSIPLARAALEVLHTQHPRLVQRALVPVSCRKDASTVRSKIDSHAWPVPVTVVVADDDIIPKAACSLPVAEAEAQRLALFAVADAAVAVSGTVTLELAAAGVPCVVVYPGHPLTAVLAKRLAAVRYVSLLNLMVDATVQPELVFDECNPVAVAHLLASMMESSTRSNACGTAHQQHGIAALLPLLQHWDSQATGFEDSMPAADKAAEEVWNLISSRRQAREQMP